jgi:hypothetical protein
MIRWFGIAAWLNKIPDDVVKLFDFLHGLPLELLKHLPAVVGQRDGKGYGFAARLRKPFAFLVELIELRFLPFLCEAFIQFVQFLLVQDELGSLVDGGLHLLDLVLVELVLLILGVGLGRFAGECGRFALLLLHPPAPFFVLFGLLGPLD